VKRKHATIGNDNVGLGPTIVLLHLAKGDPWVVGVLANNVWSLGNSNGSPAYNNARSSRSSITTSRVAMASISRAPWSRKDSMAKNFSELRARMSPESRPRAETKVKEMLAEMPP